MADLAGTWYLLAVAVFVCAGIWLSIVDVREQRLPNKILWPATGAILVLLICQALEDFTLEKITQALIVAGALFLVFAILRLISPSSLGFGDVKLSLSIGLILGWQAWQDAVLAVLLAFVLGAVFSVVALLTKRLTLKSHIAFGPFMVAGALLMLVV